MATGQFAFCNLHFAIYIFRPPSPACRLHAKRIQMPIDHRIGRQDWRFNLQKAPCIEEIPQPPEQRRAQTQVLPAGRGAKVFGHCVISRSILAEIYFPPFPFFA